MLIGPIDKKREQWIFKYNEDKTTVIGMYCGWCSRRLIYNPKRTKELIRYYNTKRFVFGGRVVIAWAPLRTGYCSQCPNNIHNGMIKRTTLHHQFYVSCMPWVGIIELCNKCHRRIHNKRPIDRPPKKDIYNRYGKLAKDPVIIS